MATQSVYLNSFLSDPDKDELVIPIYQRPYSWNSLQIQDFLSDIKFLIDNPNARHFMGLLVLTKNISNSNSFDIIDGQQRITTICIFLMIIRDKLDDIFTNNFSQLDKITQQKISGAISKIELCLFINVNQKDEKIKIRTLNERDYEQDFLNNILIKIGSLPTTDVRLAAYNAQPSNEKNTFSVKLSYMNGELGKKFDKRKVKSRRSYRNYIDMDYFIRNDVSHTNNSTLSDTINFYCDNLVKSVLDRINIVDFVTNNYEEAFNIFEVLNDRGLAITSADLIKNLCLKKCNSTSQQFVFNFWKQIFDQELNGLDDIQFLRYSNNSRRDFITKNEIYLTYSNIISSLNTTQLLAFLENDILLDASIYKMLKKEEIQHSSISINNVLKLLQSTKSTQWYSIALSILRAHSFDQSISTTDKIRSVLEKIHEIILNVILTEKKANKLERFFPTIAVKLNNYKTVNDLHSLLDDIYLSLNVFILNENMSYRSIDLDELDFQSSNHIASMLLFFIDYKECANYNLRLKSLEHILPQNPKNKNWPVIVGQSKESIEKYTYMIGNMLLIEKPLNSRIKASDFKTKQTEYISNKITDYIDATNSFHYKNINMFDFAIIEQRTKLFKEKFNSAVNSL